jgi:hypothetical protein
MCAGQCGTIIGLTTVIVAGVTVRACAFTASRVPTLSIRLENALVWDRHSDTRKAARGAPPTPSF